jgi:kynureninase
VKKELIGALRPRITSWFATIRQFDFDLEGFEYRLDARRFELGTPSLPTIHTALGGQEIIDEVGIDVVATRNAELTERLVQGLDAAGFKLALPTVENRSAIVMVHHEDPAGAVSHLAENDVIVDHRPGFVRVSPHFYNSSEEIDRCIQVLETY